MPCLARRVVLSSALAAVLLPLPLAVAAQQVEQDAAAAVEGYIGRLLQDMEGIKPLYQSDRQAYFAAVADALAQFVDFREVARGVMGKYGSGPSGATEAQLQRFAEVFRASLVDFYGSALLNYGSVSFRMLPQEQPDPEPESNSNVRMVLQAGDGSSFEVQYVMFLNQDRVWKLKNLYVEGVNLRRQYYAQFDSLMQSHGFDIDRVIDSWNAGR